MLFGKGFEICQKLRKRIVLKISGSPCDLSLGRIDLWRKPLIIALLCTVFKISRSLIRALKGSTNFEARFLDKPAGGALHVIGKVRKLFIGAGFGLILKSAVGIRWGR